MSPRRVGRPPPCPLPAKRAFEPPEGAGARRDWGQRKPGRPRYYHKRQTLVRDGPAARGTKPGLQPLPSRRPRPCPVQKAPPTRRAEATPAGADGAAKKCAHAPWRRGDPPLPADRGGQPESARAGSVVAPVSSPCRLGALPGGCVDWQRRRSGEGERPVLAGGRGLGSGCASRRRVL
ncbi:translation initiation factor IF-2-like [Rhinolophus ferrumequinum]|uniref:translation initiation factor IF-2-like n=1 Tax=Rhinolophus ferrumequinum TaxID=59479 RepID=UPI00140FF686|nr:translation initiation factor IF-2-like [Rhinolophus ferrumequinum]